MRFKTSPGDIFSIQAGRKKKKYFQFLSIDSTQLDSDVIRVFKQDHAIDSAPNFLEIANGEVDFHTHCVLKFGVKLNLWNIEGNIPEIANVAQIVFRDSLDYGKPYIKVSEKWRLWKVNEEPIFVGKLEGMDRKAEIGIVLSPKALVYRIKFGKFLSSYPGFE